MQNPSRFLGQQASPPIDEAAIYMQNPVRLLGEKAKNESTKKETEEDVTAKHAQKATLKCVKEDTLELDKVCMEQKEHDMQQEHEKTDRNFWRLLRGKGILYRKLKHDIGSVFL